GAVFAAELAQSPTAGQNGGGGGAAGDGPHHPYGRPQALAAPRPDRCGAGPRRPAQPHHHVNRCRWSSVGEGDSNLATDARKARASAGGRQPGPSAPNSKPPVLTAARKRERPTKSPAATLPACLIAAPSSVCPGARKPRSA